MKIRILSSLLLFTTLLFLTGMGNLGGTPAGTVPKADEAVNARLTDRSGVSTPLSEFSLDGNVAIEGRRGEALVSVPFRNISSIDFSVAENRDELIAHLKLKNGETVKLQVRKRLIFYGSTGYGALQVRAADVKQIDFN